MSVPFNWEKHEVAGIAHDAQAMANDALQYVLMSTLTNHIFKKEVSFNIYPNPSTGGT